MNPGLLTCKLDARSVTRRHDKVHTAADRIQFTAVGKPSNASYLTKDR